jgi:hypothetical protein
MRFLIVIAKYISNSICSSSGSVTCIVDDVLHVVKKNNISVLSLRNEMNCR